MSRAAGVRTFLAFDFGAESGRAVLAHLHSGVITTEEVHRFPNEPVEYGGSLHWDVARLWLEVRKALGKLRNLAKDRLPIGSSLSSFTRANNGQLPTDLAQLKPYFRSALGDTTLDDATLDAIFARYKLLHTGNLSDFPQGEGIVAEKAPVDKDYDTLAIFGNGFSTSTRP